MSLTFVQTITFMPTENMQTISVHSDSPHYKEIIKAVEDGDDNAVKEILAMYSDYIFQKQQNTLMGSLNDALQQLAEYDQSQQNPCVECTDCVCVVEPIDGINLSATTVCERINLCLKSNDKELLYRLFEYDGSEAEELMALSCNPHFSEFHEDILDNDGDYIVDTVKNLKMNPVKAQFIRLMSEHWSNKYMTHKQLGEHFGCSRSTIGHILNGTSWKWVNSI